MKRSLLSFSLVLSLGALAGCGGAGPNDTTGTDRSATGGVGSPRATGGEFGATPRTDLPRADAKRVGLWVTATAETKSEWEHAFVLVHKVEAIDSEEKAQTLFDDPEGTLVDLAALAEGKYLPLAAAEIAAGKPITRIRLTTGPSVQLFVNGRADSVTTPFADAVTRDASGHPTVLIPLTKPRDLASGKEDLVLAADLATLVVRDGKTVPGWREGDREAVAEPTRQWARGWVGTVRNLSGEAPAQSFVLALPGGSIAVQMGPATVAYHAAGSANPALAEGAPVTVRGTIDPATKRLNATRIALGKPEPTSVQGATANVNVAAGTFTLRARRFEGALPMQTELTVTLAEGATVRSRGGLTLAPETFWAALAESDTPVEVEGTYEPVTGALLARRAKLAGGETPGVHEVTVTAPAQDVDGKSGTVTLAAPSAWEGFAAPAKGLTVGSGPATTFRDDKGSPIDAATFFASTRDRAVRVIGLLAGDGKLTATRLEIGPAIVKPEVAKEPVAEKPGEKAAETEKTTDEKKTETPPAKPDEKPAKPADPKGT